MIKDSKINYTLNVICRWVVGLVFLFSSFVKGVDPLGTVYKVQEYMTAWSIGSLTFEWAVPLAGVLACALICAEFVVGVLLITNSYRRMTAWLLVLMMLFFTVTTFIDAVTNKVTDCGCFGDAVKLTNWQTFWKNVALDVPTVWIFLTWHLRRKKRFERDCIFLVAAVAAMLVFCIYNINHEPVIDFRPWKIGNKMIEEREAMNHMTFKDFEKWEILNSTSDEPFELKADGFSMMDMLMEDHAVELIQAEEGLVIVTIHTLDKMDAEGVKEVKLAQQLAAENDKQIVLLTAALPEEIQAWLYDNQIEGMDYLFADATAIKTMLRGNPGFMYVKDAVVVDKGRKADKLKIEN